MDSINNLKGMRTYLVGAMDRVPDGGIHWREKITPLLEKMNVNVINPCNKPIYSVIEDEETRSNIDQLKNLEQYDTIRQMYGNIRNADLRCVDISDFIVCHIDISIHACGTYEEIVTANRQKKPVLIWCEQGKRYAPNWLFFMLPHEHIFSTMEELISYLKYIDILNSTENLSRWFFFNQHVIGKL
ncbi:MAG: hypothetical protein EBU90_14415 [Proteobacteria bacterium]|nr:hypothetical protein [Pseudomonadota bacterium]NBP15381.1 hypothetical protein [bacterium]